MPNVRLVHKNKKWWVPPQKLQYARAYAMMYPQWQAELKDLRTLHSANSSGMPGAHSVGSTVESSAIRAVEISKKIDLIDECIRLSEPCLEPWLRLGVTQPGYTFYVLKARDMPCERDTYYDRRRKFYFLLSQRI